MATGEVYGNALNWLYEMDLRVADGTWRVRFDDWMFLQPSGLLLNRAKVSKFGLEIGTVTLAFVKPSSRTNEVSELLNELRFADAPRQAAFQ